MTFILEKLMILAVVVLCAYVDFTTGHGRMVEPAARNTMWRFNYKNPRNYNDMGLNCGGFPNQFERQGGRCGVCGDPFQGPRDNEAGGKYARGVIARQYQTGSFINITVELTSNHKGYMEFRLCPVNNPRVKATQSCLDRNLLNIIGHGTRYFITENGANVFIELLVMLPPKLQCSQCVLQWKWVAGQSMGPDGFGGECMGCGNQEHFINCADVAVGPQAVKPLPPLPKTAGNNPQSAPQVPEPGPGYNVVNDKPNTGGYGMQPEPMQSQGYNNPNTAGYGMKPKPMAVPGYNPRPVPAAPKPKPTTPSPWNMDPNAMYQKLMSGAFGQADFMAPAQSPWNSPWQQQQPQQQLQPQQLGPAQQQTEMNQMYGFLSSMFREPTDWTTDTPYQPPPQQRIPVPPTQHTPGYDTADYAGYEPGEYPEADSPSPSHNNGAPSGGNGQGGSYMQGFNDALRQMQQGLGLSGEWNTFNPKASRAVSEITLSLQEKQKQQSSVPNCPGRVCKADGSWKGQSNIDSWCDNTCKVGQCPSHMCACMCPGSGGWGR